MKCLRKYLIKCIKHFKKKLTREKSDKKTTNVDSYFSDAPIRKDKEEKIIEKKIEGKRTEKNEEIFNKNEINDKIKEEDEKPSIFQEENDSKDKEKLTNSSSESSIIEEENPINLGINIGSSKTVYSIFGKINGKFLTHVLLMNNSSRIIPSIICYTNTHRLIGDNSINSIKQYLDSSYNNLSRLIGFENNKFINNELKFGFGVNDNINNFNFYWKNGNNKYKNKSEYLISDFLSLINDYFFNKNQIDYDFTSLSVPDFFTQYQKKMLKIICKSIKLKKIKIFNESSAITMYYGHVKYRDLFVIEKNEIDITIEKNILFIDLGYSKSNIFLSKFKYNHFSVEKLYCLSEFGGRNLDDKIFEYCIKKFKKKNMIDNLEITARMKYKLNEEIIKSKKKLSLNTEINIIVDAFYDDIDLNIYLKREKFEELIKDYLNEFEEVIQKFIDDSNIKIDYVEMAGEIMRIPSFQKIIFDKNLSLSKTIIIDECTSVGSSVLGSYYNKGDFPLSHLQKFTHYNYYNIYCIISNDKFILFKEGKINENLRTINLQKYISNNNFIFISFESYKKENDNEIFIENLGEFKITILEDFKKFNDQFPFFQIEIDEAQNLCNEKIIFNNNEYSEIIEKVNTIINKDEERKIKSCIENHIKKQEEFDEDYELFINEKTRITKILYRLKEKINDKNLLTKINLIDRKLRKVENNRNNVLNEIENELIQIENNNSVFDL